jgi:uncharacterized protein with NAD-binding domain and iron-sulfur cluster
MERRSTLSRARIAVLGGGVGAMSAAWALAHAPNAPEVTVYQMGWRLGGKGASGRNMREGFGARIEEHGVHVWSGLYDNAFRVLRAAYEEAQRPSGIPLASIDAAFFPHNFVVLMEQWNGQWIPWEIELPYNDLTPGTGDGSMPSLPTIVSQSARWMLALITGNRRWFGDAPSLEGTERTDSRFAPLVALLGRVAAAGASQPLSRSSLVASLRAVSFFMGRAFAAIRDRLDDSGTRRLWITLHFALANLRGLIEDRALERGFDALDDEDYLQWLARFSVDDGGLMSRSPLARFLYDAEFAYLDGDLSRPDLAAGASLRTLLRMAFTWKGALLWKMRAGMGDVVFAPMYEALVRRGVRFEFFRRVESLGLNADGARVASVRLGVQARSARGYEPFVDVRGLPCWPSEPKWNLLDDSPAVRARCNFEDPSCECDEFETLELGRDFDSVVFALPVAAHRRVASALIEANPRWRAAVEHVATVATQAVQLWLHDDSEALGWSRGGRPLLGAFQASPLNTWVDMSHMLPWEDWDSLGSRAPRSVSYFCGPLPESPNPSDTMRACAEALFAGPMHALWPVAVDSVSGLDASRLVRQGEPRSNPLHEQYLRFNAWPSERFTLSVAGSTKHRLAPGESGFDNLALAGDWTANGFNIGNVEAATMSGLLASHALTGFPSRDSIVGLDFGRGVSPKGE